MKEIKTKWDPTARKQELLSALSELETQEMDGDTKVLCWKRIVSELDVIETQEELQREAYEAGYKKSYAQGKFIGEIESEISNIKTFLKMGIPEAKIINSDYILKFLKHEKVRDNLEANLKYIGAHIEDSDSDICSALGLIECLLDYYVS
jgi:hypothetical protein